ncbi:hypothetical protein OCU04_008725 [Sclerotinia nivalis]|uniref:FAD-binding domain-containing protein n=1 Tax=Sclerotinia nivalis TaxID=352851 RepID=A0A9X0AG44_9HELO|nr:hypothetical protein OCU04_008725 [Sclerotinia nivalis]
MTTPPPTKKIRIAIIGGGLAGATLIHSLLKQPHLSIHIYESASVFSERGAAVGLAINAQNALSKMGMAEVVSKAGGVRMNSSRTIVASGPHADDIIFDLASELQGLVVHRAELLKELLAPVPKEYGTNVEADAVIGADGIHGFVRSYILGKDHPATKARFAGFWDCRSLVSMQKAKEVLGEKYFEEQRQYAWCGDGGFFLHDVLDGGGDGAVSLFCLVPCVEVQDGLDVVFALLANTNGMALCRCVGSVMTSSSTSWESDEKNWKKDLDRSTLEAAFESWTNSPIPKPMIEVCIQANLTQHIKLQHRAERRMLT